MRFVPLLFVLLGFAVPLDFEGQTSCESCTLSFSSESLNPVEISCSDGNPMLALPNFPAFTTTCNAGYWASIFKHTTGSSTSCAAVRADGLASSLGTIQLQDFTATGLTSTNKFNESTEGLTWTVYPENVARLQGTVINANNVNARFEVDFYFNQGTTGAAWTAAGGNVNDNAATSDEVAEWTVWQIKPHISKLVGAGDLAGEVVYLETSNLLVSYPFQEGYGANGINGGLGLGGSFDWISCVEGVIYGGYGVTSTDFTSCEESSSICASDNDAVAEYFIGNLESFDQIQGFVDVTDDTPPVLGSLPPDYLLNCPVDLEELDAEFVVTASDDCSTASLSLVESVVNGTCPSEFTRTRTYTATDGCGLTSTHVQTVEVVDQVAPSLTAPSNATFSCSEGPTYATAFATDACDGILPVTEGEPTTVEGDCPGEYTVYRTFSATDLCGNTSTGQQTVFVRDNTPPVLQMPDDVVLPCGSSFVYPPATATDNCTEQEDISIAIFNSLPPTNCPQEYILERRFLATDLCGNSVLEIQTVTVTDGDVPYFTFVPADETYSCDEDPMFEDAVADDDCSSYEITTSLDTVFQGCDNNYDLVRTFVVTDACGNFAEATQTLSIRDNIAPTIFSELTNPTVECSEVWEPSNLEASDNCSGVSWSTTVDTVGAPSTGAYSLHVLHVATDECGNSAQTTQTVTVVDSTPPVFTSVPQDLTLSCEEEIPFEAALATDMCSSVVIEISEDLELGVLLGVNVLSRTFTATDAQGNTTSATQTITIQDATAPEFTYVPADYTAECSDDMPMDDATASDNCGTVTIEVTSETSPGDAAGNYVVTRTFAATDDAGNSSSATQTITVQDTTAPEFTFVPADYTVECSDDMPLDEATAADNCGTVVVTVTSETTPGDAAGNYVVTRTFTATDDAGNSASASQSITVQDTTAPEFTFVPADYTAECSDDMPMDEATAADNCGTATVDVTTETTPGDAAGNYVVVRTFTATDDAGNSTSATQTITVQDTTAPEFTFVPADYAVECSDDMPVANAAATDNCGTVTIEVVSETTPGDAAGNYILTRTFTATDDAGNSASATQTITVEDTTPPSLAIPEDYTVECSAGLVLEPAQAVDNCGSTSISVVVETIPGNAMGNYVVTRTFTATDDAGNSVSATQTITVQDTTAPAFTIVPADYTVECSDDMPLDDATAADNCGTVTVDVASETVPGDAAGNYVIVRTFTATDDAGNSASATQSITVQDTTAPEFTFVPADYTAECSDDFPMDDANAADNCGEVTVTVASETTPGDAEGNYTITRTFTATDDAGNSTSATQTITVQDTTAPEFTFVPADYTVECSDDMPMEDASAEDNCGEVTLTVASEITPGNAEGNYTMTRTFTATDDAGNSASATQAITVQDTTAPSLNVPADYTVECSEGLTLEPAQASDNCGSTSISVVVETIPGIGTGNYIVTRTFTATDDAGNSASATQTITVEDTTPPSLAIPEDYTVECSAGLVLDPAQAEDNCGTTSISVVVETTAGNATGNYVVTRTFTATDDAGNSVSATQTITVQDTTAPEFTFVPTDYTVECSDDMPLDDATAADNCGTVTVDVASETVPGDAAGDYVIVRTFTVTDDAGNSSSATQNITVQDTTAPEFTFVPADYTAECSDDMPMDDANAADNCGEVTVTVASETTPGDAEGNYTITRTFTATDDAGNSSSATQTITVQDTTAPEFTFVPSDYTVECSDDMPMGDASAEDNCGEVTLTVASEITPGNAEGNYTMTRTFTATDDAGNSASATQTITVQDTTPPEFTFVPESQFVECTEALSLESPLVSDLCSSVSLAEVTDTLPGLCGDLVTLVRTFTATDESGNQSTVTQTLTQVDTHGPTFDLIEEVNLSCSQNLNAVPIPTVNDACSEVPTLIWNDLEVSGGCALPVSAVVRTYTAIDACGNLSTAEQMIQLTDTVAPVWEFVPEDVTLGCSESFEFVPAVASDNCAAPSVTWSVDTLGNVSTGVYQVVFTFLAVDDCDNVSEHEHVVNVVDTVEPEWEDFPADQAMSCDGDLDDSMPSASDACSDSVNVTLVSEEFFPGECEGSGNWVRTFAATDWNGNVLTSSQTVAVVDDVAPEFISIPEDVVIECDDPMPTSMATASDNCSEPLIEVSESLTDVINDGNYTLIRTFTATDACGNATSATQTVLVVDTTAPFILTELVDMVVECDSDFSPLELQTTDACSSVVEVSVTDLETPGSCDGEWTVQRTYVVTDESGNADSTVVVLDVVDTTAPVWTAAPENVTVSCDGPFPSNQAEAEDACSEVTVVLVQDTLLGNSEGNYQVTQTWTAADACMNTSMWSRIVTVVDTASPVVIYPPDTTLACDQTMPVWEPLAGDNCGPIEWAYEDSLVSGDCPGHFSVIRHFTVTDDAGNESQGSQVISVIDTVAPSFSYVPEFEIWECNAPAELDSAVASDNCSGVELIANLDTLVGLGANQWTLLVTWTATDACGNSAQATQEIDVLDQLAPEIQAGPLDTTLDWGNELMLDAWQSELMYSDSCSSMEDLTVDVAVDTLPADVACLDQVVLTWSVSDLAGNEAQWVQHIDLIDVDAPVWDAEPENEVLACDEVWVPFYPGGSDHNEFSFAEELDTLAGTCPSEFTVTRTLVAADVCGNEALPWVQILTVVDTVAPVVDTWPEDLVLTDPLNVPDCESNALIWTDNCSDAVVDCATDTIEEFCPGSFLLERTYTVTDACGNVASVQQSILVEDVEEPVFEDLPNEVTYACDTTLSPPSIGELTLTDNQSTTDEIVANVLELDSEGDECSSFTTFRYTAVDGCGNMTEVFYTQIREDNDAPVLTTPLEDLEFICLGEVPSFDDQMFLLDVEDCQSPADGGPGYDVGLVATAVDEFEGGDCTGPDCLLTRTITVDDNCGNVAMFEQVIVVSEPPTVPELPTGFSPNNDSFNDVYRIRNAGPDLGLPPCDWLDNTTFTVFDRWGSVVYQSNDVSIPWDGSNISGRPLPVGTYFVVFEANGQTYRATVDLRR